MNKQNIYLKKYKEINSKSSVVKPREKKFFKAPVICCNKVIEICSRMGFSSFQSK